TNLISNAIKYSPREQPISISLQATDAEVVIEVTDRGTGIPANEQEGIFEAFTRGKRALADAPGAGLGLYNVRRIVKAHGGRIELESQPGHGSTFRLHLPRYRADDATRAARTIAVVTPSDLVDLSSERE